MEPESEKKISKENILNLFINATASMTLGAAAYLAVREYGNETVSIAANVVLIFAFLLFLYWHYIPDRSERKSLIKIASAIGCAAFFGWMFLMYGNFEISSILNFLLVAISVFAAVALYDREKA